jgi:glycosyltransferase involved in cell wall biosynthesis
MPDISLCIPVYNFFSEPLVAKLFKEISEYSISAEIIVIDDASDPLFRTTNRTLTEKYPINYVQLEKNIGRSAIRNLFQLYVKSPLLLFLDCDVMPMDDKFISNYLSATAEGPIVMCGGIKYPQELPSAKNKLHWEYGRKRESLPAIKRNKNSYSHFLASNFIVPGEVIKVIRFNEELRGYGYEDTLYGIELEKKGIGLRHIDNPAEHLKLDTAEEFILKTENALKNLYDLYRSNAYSLEHYIKLVKANNFFKALRLSTVAAMIYSQFGKGIMRRSLLNGSCNLTLLDWYKLLFFIALQKEK